MVPRLDAMLQNQNPVSSNFEDMGFKEITEVAEILNAYASGNTTRYYNRYFENNEIKPCFNLHSGYVFLTNSEYQSAMMNGKKLDVFESCHECGNEGFPHEFKDAICEGCQEINTRFLEVKA